jgi:CHAD domain-containing protein
MSTLDPYPLLRRLDAHAQRALMGDDEAVHQLRIALRRLRVWLTLGRHSALEGDLKWLGRQVGPLRDVHVLEGVFTAKALARRRTLALERVRKALRSQRWASARTRLAALPKPSRRQAKKVTRHLEKKLARSTVALDDQKLHALRRKHRVVRYAREWLGYGTKKQKRELAWLGPLCDLLLLERALTFSRP